MLCNSTCINKHESVQTWQNSSEEFQLQPRLAGDWRGRDGVIKFGATWRSRRCESVMDTLRDELELGLATKWHVGPGSSALM
ncbi:hypothetical protein PanWU01x14_324010, partial [Parasponia andersonii]